MKNLTQKLSLTLIILVSLFALFPHPSYAQQLGNNSLSLGFAPTSQFLTLSAGSRHTGEVTVWNLSPVPRVYNVIIRGFKQIENYPGTARIHSEAEEERDVFSAAKWIQIPYTQVNLMPNQYTKIPYEITVPANSASGEFHAMIFLVSQAPNIDLDINSTSTSNLGSGPVIFVKVGDKIVEQAEIEYFRSEKSFYELPPISFQTRYINKGNTHITPAGDIIIENFLGQEIDKVTFNSNRQSLLRGNAGNYTDEWHHQGVFLRNGKLAIGPLKARLITTYRSENPGHAPLSAVTTFWVLPWKHILAIVLIVGIIYRLISSLRKRNEQKTRSYDPIASYPKYN